MKHETTEKVAFMAASLVELADMTDSDLLDMHYFLTEEDAFDDDEFEEGFCIF